MKKYYLINGKEVKMGDCIVKTSKTKHPIFGQCVTTTCVVLNKGTIPTLLEKGIVIEKDSKLKESKSEEKDLTYYIQQIADKMGWKIEKAFNCLNMVDKIFPAAAFSIILRQIAIDLDKKYEDHIENSPEIYVVSLLDGRITKVNKAIIKNYRNFAAFRNIEDAKFACRITKDVLKTMFNHAKK